MREERGGIIVVVMESWRASRTDTAGMHVQLRVIVNTAFVLRQTASFKSRLHAGPVI